MDRLKIIDWDYAYKWQDSKNLNKKDDSFEPNWKFDCNFKLDFDGGLLSVNSRFYPPCKCYGEDWDGLVEIYLLGVLLKTKEFKCKNLDILHAEVEGYIQEIKKDLLIRLEGF